MHASAVDEQALSPHLAMDAVTLRVGDLEEMSSYYAEALALTPIEERARGTEVHRVLGRGSVPFVRLIGTPELPPVRPGDAGLFHTAFLFASQAALAATVFRTASDARSRFSGSSDHGVSEAFYFTDPEGNGIELYVDRARDQWSYVGAELQMGTEYLDPNAYLRAHLDEQVLADVEQQAGGVGHVHLQVGDVAAARGFYVDGLGFEPTVSGIPTALFASAGGYHHHVAMNTWNSRGAGPRAARLGLGDVAITLPAREDLDALGDRLRRRGIAFADTGRSIIAHDPWGTQVTLALPQATAEELLSD
ncbi:VOC family protein [Leucobacter japonicus]|uniref:VOC family protein n=1 Tax=Leucobacter japonicus TaxID=1461259 RepID=UPI0006A75F07|nr:VOC family protein [Leucobacter japonicus]